MDNIVILTLILAYTDHPLIIVQVSEHVAINIVREPYNDLPPFTQRLDLFCFTYIYT